MSEQQVNLQDVLNELKVIIGQQAQEIAILRAGISQLSKDREDSDKVE